VTAALALTLLFGAAGHGELENAMEALHAEDVETAAKIVEPMAQAHPDDGAVKAVMGVLRFHQQRYAEAVKLLEEAGPGEDWYLRLAQDTKAVTSNYGRAEGEHFVVTFPKGKDEILVPYVLEALEGQRAALEKDLGYAPPGKVTIEFLNDTRALAKASTLTEEEIKTSGTIAICKFNKLMVVSPKALLKGYDWLDTAAHEYTHYVVTRRTRNNTPIWLHEGIAKYEESRWRGGPGLAFSPFAAALLKDAVKKDKLITFAQMHPSMAKLPSQEAAALAFAEVMVAVEYLSKKGGVKLMNKVLDLVEKGESAEDAVAHAQGVAFDAFLSDWKKYMRDRPLPEGGAAELEKLRFKDDPKHGGSWSEWADIPDEKARGFARLGEIMRERGKWEGARTEYGKAAKRVGFKHAVLADKYALVSMMVGKDADAEGALAEALRTHPRYAALHLHLARLYVKRKIWDRAKDELLLANRTDPFDPEIHAGLATAYDAMGDKGGASREKGFAQILIGKDAGHGAGPAGAPAE
jgi:tetratricopeptide (TPR) repeat protein